LEQYQLGALLLQLLQKLLLLPLVLLCLLRLLLVLSSELLLAGFSESCFTKLLLMHQLLILGMLLLQLVLVGLSEGEVLPHSIRHPSGLGEGLEGGGSGLRSLNRRGFG